MQKAWTVRGLIFAALFAALTMAMSYLTITLPGTPIAIVLTTIAIMLAGGILGPLYGFISLLIATGLEIAGLPVLFGPSVGLARLLGPSGGYLIAYPVAAWLIGWASARVEANNMAFMKLVVINFLGGAILLYIPGVAWLAHSYHMTSLQQALTAGMYPFLIGDAIKAIVAAAVVIAVQKVYPREKLLGID